MKKEYPHLETERNGAVLIIRLANEAARNSLTREIRFSLRDVVREVQDDYSIRAIYLTAKGQTFCAGGDLRMLSNGSEPWPAHRRFRHASTLFPPLMTLDRPVVCGVRGMAVGGGFGLALMADSIVATQDAKFMAGFFRLGVVPDCLTLFTLPRLVGLAKARNFFYSNATWTAQDALENGVVSKIVDDDQLDIEGLALAQRYAEGPAQVMGLAKTILLKSFESSLDEMMGYENLAQVLAQSGPEFNEGLNALKEKRRAEFMRASNVANNHDGMSSFEG
ncbi:enoyl-CoA hydratase [Falsochrobactrum shanghaiense]|uniref:Enoyl-CoA hydratase n=1 Tax=Falsochrobactrum shanghaiense TaxID=2201899 RepID=A0A316J6R8_9HYPH|nr:enoyl-CoA hydratase/isomerase family protein [Falsochrobactrum shanghaiense]PWL16465.1 enoyl-CoA hydratase [Falsochrobactrum shanghaiense]